MEKRRCYGCMELTDQPVCPRCGSGAVENSPHQLRAGTVLAGRFLVGKALGQSSSGILYLGLDQTRGEPVNLLEYYPAQDGRRNGNLVEPAGEQAAARFAQGKAWFARVSQLLAGERELAEVSGFRDGFEANGTAYRVASLCMMKNWLPAVSLPVLLRAMDSTPRTWLRSFLTPFCENSPLIV